MKYLKLASILSFVLLLPSCFTYQSIPLSDDYTFKAEDNFGLLAFSSPYVTHNSFVSLNRIEEGKDTLSEPTLIYTGSSPTYSIGSEKNPEFRIHKLLPGTYVWSSIQRGNFNYYNYCRGTLAFEIEAGKVNLVVARKAPLDHDALTRLKRQLKPYQQIKAPVDFAKIPYAVRFDFSLDEKNGCNRAIVEDVKFKTIPWQDFIRNSDPGEVLD